MNAIQLNQDDSLIKKLLRINDTYNRAIRPYIDYLDTNNLSVNEESVRAYFRYLNWESGLSAGTINMYRSAVKARIRAVFTDSADIETYHKMNIMLHRLDKMHDTKPRKIASKAVERDRYLTREEVKELLTACRSERQRVYIRFLFLTGCRASEMCHIKLSDCQIRENVKIRVLGKGSKERFVKIPLRFYEEVKIVCNSSVFLFETSQGKSVHPTYVSGQIKKIGRRIGKEISAHTLRHSWATEQVKINPGKISAVSRYMGHSTPSITLQMYVHDELSNEELFSIDI